MAPKFEIYKDSKGKFRFRLKSSERRDHSRRRGLREQCRLQERDRVSEEERADRGYGGFGVKFLLARNLLKLRVVPEILEFFVLPGIFF